MNKVYLLKETCFDAYGDSALYVNVYEMLDKAKEAMKRDAEEHIENDDAYIYGGGFDDCFIVLFDEEKNQYTLEIESTIIQ